MAAGASTLGWDEAVVMPNCEICGNEFKRRVRTNDSNRCCSRECGFALQRREKAIASAAFHESAREGAWTHWYFSDCETCGGRFIQGNHKGRRRRFCGSACEGDHSRRAALASYLRKRPTDLLAKQCRKCHHPFNVKRERGASNRLCGECAAQNKKASRRDAKTARSRARKAGVPFAVVRRQDVIAKYGLKCWLCGEEIPLQRATQGQQFSLDHVVPLSLGGWHDIRNVRPAHHACNSKRSNEFKGQLMLLLNTSPLTQGASIPRVAKAVVTVAQHHANFRKLQNS